MAGDDEAAGGAGGGVGHGGQEVLDGGGFECGVSVDGQDHLGADGLHAEVECRGLAALVHRGAEDGGAEGAGDLPGTVFGAVIDDDDFDGLGGLGLDAADGVGDGGLFVVGGDEDGYAGDEGAGLGSL
jgi:hypothetical protein